MISRKNEWDKFHVSWMINQLIALMDLSELSTFSAVLQHTFRNKMQQLHEHQTYVPCGLEIFWIEFHKTFSLRPQPVKPTVMNIHSIFIKNPFSPLQRNPRAISCNILYFEHYLASFSRKSRCNDGLFSSCPQIFGESPAEVLAKYWLH